MKITHRSFCIGDTDEEQDAPPARRRCIFPNALVWKKPPSGREVDEPRTPKSLRPTPPAAPLASSPSASKTSTRSAARRSGGGSPAHGDSREPRARGEGQRSAVDLQGAPPPERTSTTRKLSTGDATTSMTTPAGDQLLPTLCTRRDPAIPHPPAAGAADGGWGITRIAGGEVGAAVGLKSRLSLTVREEGNDQGRSARTTY